MVGAGGGIGSRGQGNYSCLRVLLQLGSPSGRDEDLMDEIIDGIHTSRPRIPSTIASSLGVLPIRVPERGAVLLDFGLVITTTEAAATKNTGNTS